MSSPQPEAPTVEPGSEGPPPALLADLINSLVKAVRAHQIYQANSPVYQNFVQGVRREFERVLERAPVLTLATENEVFRCGKETFASGEGRDSVAFVFYRDGVRSLTFLQGFGGEVERFLETIRRARVADREGDDMITLLWEGEFSFLQYDYQNMLAEGVKLPESSPPAGMGTVAVEMVEQELEAAEDEAGEELRPLAAGEAAYAAEEAQAAGVINPNEFEQTLYFLSEPELAVLKAETEEEWERDLKGPVLNALFDRLEEPGHPARQKEILGIVGQLIPINLARGDLAAVATMLRELDQLLGKPDLLAPGHREDAEAVFDQLSDPRLIRQLVQSLEDESITPSAEELALFLGHLRAPALPALLMAAEEVGSEDLRALLQDSIARIARERVDEVVKLLESGELAVVQGAVRLVGKLGLADAVPRLRQFLQRRDSNELRNVTVQALVDLHSGAAMDGLKEALLDSDRDVRVTALRGLGSLQYKPAAPRLEELVQSREIRDADLTEKIATFEAFAQVGGSQAVPTLDKVLNAKGLLGRRPPADVRACAARALGLIRSPSARKALERAEGDGDAVVRSAVARALRGESAE